MPVKLSVNVELKGLGKDEAAPPSRVYVFDGAGTLAASAPLEKAALRLPDRLKGQMIGVVVGPELQTEEREKVGRSQLLRLGGYQKRVRLGAEAAVQLDVSLVDAVWRDWFLCPCVVRGRLVKRLPLPDGTTRELPICHARVTICEVDPWPRIVWKLPDDWLWRLRDELLWEIRRPFPPPPPEPPIIRRQPPPAPKLIMSTPVLEPATAGPAPLGEFGTAASGAPEAITSGAREVSARPLAADTPVLRTIASTSSLLELRRALVDAADLIRPYICRWDWLWPLYDIDCLKSVMVDEEGRFETTLLYPCRGDRPDLYFSAEQWNGSSWTDVYSPSVACHTYWNYACGSEIVISVTSPAAVPCAPDDPVAPPEGVGTWVMPYAVGNMKVWGNPSGAGAVPAGFVRPDGLVDYGGVADAPFGHTLGLRQGKSADIPTAAIKYYRWSFRPAGTATWKPLTAPVGRHYVRQEPGQLPTFPVYSLGPKPIAGGDLFEFRPHTPPDEPPADPPGTQRYWPTDSWFGDIYSGFFDTVSLVGGTGVVGSLGASAGEYQLKLEAFDEDGTLVMPGPGKFTFIVPDGVTPDGTVTTREAQSGELDGGGFVFKVHIDNNDCSASIAAPAIGATSVTDACGFLRYPKNTNPGVTIAFSAEHPNNRATFGFGIVRGTAPVTGAAASGEVGAAVSGAYSGDGAGHFAHDFAREALTTTGCDEAAFSENLGVDAKATNGWSRLSQSLAAYRADAVRAFALAEGPPGP